MSSDLVRRIGPEFVKSEMVSYCAFGSGKPQGEEMRNLYSLELRGLKAGCGLALATEVPIVCAPLFRRRLPEMVLKSLGHLKLAEDYNEERRFTVDILIGLDQYWKFVRPDIKPVKDQDMMAQRTVFGWILSGSCAVEGTGPKSVVSHQLLCIQKVTDEDLRKLWDTELEKELQME